jgi:SAM-dependent methyltransferase
MSAPAPRIFTPDYYTRMSALEAGSWWNAAMRDTAARLLEGAGLPRVGMALDVGCGSGQTIAWLRASLPEWRFAGLDVAPEGLAAARGRGEDVTLASALAIPFPTACADLVASLDVLQHLPLPDGDRAALGEMRRILRPGGLLLLRTNAQAFPRTTDDPAAQFRKYEAGALRARLEAAGFAVERIGRLNALLGLAEIPRELRARRMSGTTGYHGLLAAPRPAGRADRLKGWWLRLEGRAVASGVPLPMGRTILALCRARPA